MARTRAVLHPGNHTAVGGSPHVQFANGQGRADRYTKATLDIVAHVERSIADPRRGGRRAWDDASIRKPVLIDQMMPSSPS